MPLSALFIIDENGKVLIFRDYRGDFEMEVINDFFQTMNKTEDSGVPILHCPPLSFAFIRKNDLIIASVIKRNANIVLIFIFLQKFLEILLQYFDKIESESIQDNFVIIYEILDEIIDFGYPQTTDSSVLQTYITQESYKCNNFPSLPSVITNVVSWRPPGIRYRQNEVFIDVIESINMTMNSNGVLLKNEVAGAVKMKVNLSGMPQLRLGLSDKICTMIQNQNDFNFEGVSFHHCVQLSRLNEKNIYFVPPDGEFELMSYRLNTDLRPLILVRIVISTCSRSTIEYQLSISSQFRRNSTANNVEIILPVDPNSNGHSIKATTGNAYFDAGIIAVVWKIKNFPGSVEHFLQANFKLYSFKVEDRRSKIPVQVKFTIPYFTVSGLQIKFIKVIEKEGYKALTWVKYSTNSGEYYIHFPQ